MYFWSFLKRKGELKISTYQRSRDDLPGHRPSARQSPPSLEPLSWHRPPAPPRCSIQRRASSAHHTAALPLERCLHVAAFQRTRLAWRPRFRLCASMAKPKPSSSSPSLATSKTFSKPKANRKGHPHGSRRRPLNSSPVPSSGLLAFLAGLTASSSTAYGHPVDTQVLPPDFLCPGLSSDHPSAVPLTPQPSSSRRAERRGDTDRPRPSQRRITKRESKRPFVPPKYIQGQDGRWRKIANWTLYGYCNVSLVLLIH